MSTKILQGAEVKLAMGLVWRPAGGGTNPEDEAAASEEQQNEGTEAEAAAHPPPQPLPPPPPASPPGPGWDEFRALEAQLRDLKARIPELEARARAEGRAEGKNEGRAEGEKAGLEQWQAAIDRAAASVEQITSLRSRLRKEAERDVVGLSLAIARRVLRRELTVDPETVGGLVRGAFERVDAAEVHRVRVRPEDAARMAERLARIGGSQKIDVVADPALEAGSLIVETARGQLDVSVESQLSEIERGFADLLPRPGK